MTRILSSYTPMQIAASVAQARELDPGAHDALIADIAGVLLSGRSGAYAAADQVAEWLADQRAQRAVEGAV